ncbi:PucR family transcriptional regulator [Pseudoclavibacter terrae]|uniref:PucR family transcriptional regulator n=1 Tax=Pseudoclavibacter terrae TaxID=1530195 RepID=UPI00232ED623|nr:PucR family transcriptional regulator [Pseudoclavibacter terrae]
MTSVDPSPKRASRDVLTIADLVGMQHLGLELVAGAEAVRNPVLWTHVSELEDPGPWLEGGELLIVNGFGIPRDEAGQVSYLSRLAQHRLAGLAVSSKGPVLTKNMLDEADKLGFPVLLIPRQVPFVEISHLVANASERSARARLSKHLRIFDTLRLRNAAGGSQREIYEQLQQICGYQLAVLSRAGRPLLEQWTWTPNELDLRNGLNSVDLSVVPGGYILPLFVGERVTAYLIGMESDDMVPGGLAALQHVSSLAALDAIDDQRRREAMHRRSSALLAAALDHETPAPRIVERFEAAGFDWQRGMRFLSVSSSRPDLEIEMRDWLTDREIPHLLLHRDALNAVVDCEETDIEHLANDHGISIGVSSRMTNLRDIRRMQRVAVWASNHAVEGNTAAAVFADQQFGLTRWLNPDIETIGQLAEDTLQPLVDHDQQTGSELLRTLTVYFNCNGRIRVAAAQLFVHEHTMSYRLKRIEQLTDRNLKTYRDLFELWLAVDARSLGR